MNLVTKEIARGGLFVFVLIMINYAIAKSDIVYHCNPGIAFGVMLPPIAFQVLWIVTMAVVVYMWAKTPQTKEYASKRLGLLLICTGGVANIADRFLHGCVIDYITLVPWNSFNLADTSIFIGAMLVLWQLRGESRVKEENTVQ